jgi:hypothetical protein
MNTVWQRVPVAASCLCFVALLKSADSLLITSGVFVVVGFLACLEKLASTANTVAVERDWVGEHGPEVSLLANAIPWVGYCHF